MGVCNCSFPLFNDQNELLVNDKNSLSKNDRERKLTKTNDSNDANFENQPGMLNTIPAPKIYKKPDSKVNKFLLYSIRE